MRPARLFRRTVRQAIDRIREGLRVMCGRTTVGPGELVTVAELRDQLAVARSQVGSLAASLAEATSHAQAVRGGGSFDVPPGILRAAGEEIALIVDVGAQNLASQDHVYATFAARVPSRIVGFEPLDAEREARQAPAEAVVMLPHVVGDGGPGELRETRFSPASSMLEPDHAAMADFLALPEMLEVVSRRQLHTVRLDDVPETNGCRILKIDVQGGELDVLRGGIERLASAVLVFVEVEFFPVYSAQPLFPEVHDFLQAHGFELLDLVDPGYGSYRAADLGDVSSRLLWADGLYVRRLYEPGALPAVALVQLACAAHYFAAKYDYAAHVLAVCDRWHGTAHADAYRRALHAAYASRSAAVTRPRARQPER